MHEIVDEIESLRQRIYCEIDWHDRELVQAVVGDLFCRLVDATLGLAAKCDAMEETLNDMLGGDDDPVKTAIESGDPTD